MPGRASELGERVTEEGATEIAPDESHAIHHEERSS